MVKNGAHALVVNSKALEICRLAKDLSKLKPEEGYVYRDENGELLGYFYEWGAQLLVSKYMPQLNEEEIEECIIRVQKHLNSHGVTSDADILGIGGDYPFCGTWGQKVIEVYEKMAREGKLL